LPPFDESNAERRAAVRSRDGTNRAARIVPVDIGAKSTPFKRMETELKLTIPAAARARIDDHPAVRSSRADSPVERHQVTTQEVLGTINDAAATERIAAKLAEKGCPDLAPAIGALAKWNEGRRRKACSHLDKVWKEFRGATPFWH